MSDGEWRSLAQLATAVSELTGRSASEAGVSARLRDLRKEKFGGHHVERQKTEDIYQYRVLIDTQVLNPIVPPLNLEGTKTERTTCGPVAGSKEAQQYCDSLSG